MPEVSCGPSGSTGQEIVDEINRHANTSLAKLGGVNPTAETVTTSFTVLSPSSQETNFKGDGATADTAAQSITIHRDMLAWVTYSCTMTFEANRSIAFAGSQNGNPIPITGEKTVVQGLGANEPVPFNYVDVVQLYAGDVIGIGANTLASTASLTWHTCSIIVNEIV